MNEKDFKGFVDNLADYTKQNLIEIKTKDVVKQEQIQEIKKMFLRSLNIQCTIAKIFYSIGYYIIK